MFFLHLFLGNNELPGREHYLLSSHELLAHTFPLPKNEERSIEGKTTWFTTALNWKLQSVQNVPTLCRPPFK